jgi:uncharacterized protein with von Willebrand factor type A (vWA) domain
MKYSTLIRRLLQASEESKWRQKDVAEILRERCVDGADPIRQTLMNAVCDPRFKLHVGVLKDWKKKAQVFLEECSEKLMSIQNLTEDVANEEMDEMLNRWLRMAMEEAQLADGNGIKFIMVPKGESGKSYIRMREAIEEYVNGDEDDKQEKVGEDDEEELTWNSKAFDDKEKEEKEEEEGTTIDTDYDLDGEEEVVEENLKSISKGWRKNHKVIENHFLTKVPPSLIKLAKLIGRSGDGIMESEGTFFTASKSDIGGITTGNDLNSLLPSELALLSEPSTQALFYKNYATKRLQVFSSMSHESNGKKHRDGPIIICMDASGSMEGIPVIVAKAITIALCIIAQRRRRRVLVIKYSNSHEMFTLRNIEQQRKELISFLSTAELAGNNENSLFQWLFNEVMPNERDYNCADILCISDFGWTPIEEDTMELIKKEKAKGVVFYGLNIADDNEADEHFGYHNIFKTEHRNGTPEDVCDSLWEFKNGVCYKVNRSDSTMVR